MTYGLNVVVAIAAAAALTVLINWMVYRQPWMLDLSAGRRYTLAEQTLNLLRELEDEHRIVTLLDDPGDGGDRSQAIIRARDLVNEYGRRSPNIRTEHINPTHSPQLYEAFLASLADRFADDLAPMRSAIDDGRQALDLIRLDVTRHVGPLHSVLENPQFTHQQSRLIVEQIATAFISLGERLASLQQSIEEATQQTLPPYTGARDNLARNLTRLSSEVYSIAIDRFERVVRTSGVPADVQETLLATNDGLRQTLESIRQSIRRLNEVEAVAGYDHMLLELRQRDPIVVIGSDEVRVISLEQMFRPVPQDMGEQATEPAFQGEERLTGALVSMTLKDPPLVVFVSDSAALPFGRDTSPALTYREVGSRLSNMNFEVAQWTPAGTGGGRFGQPQAAEPPPMPRPGQKGIWIILPGTPADPRNPLEANYRQQVASLLKSRLEAGDAAMLMFGYSDLGRFGQIDPVIETIAAYNITPQTDRAILREQVRSDRRTVADSLFSIERWAGDLPIGRAIDGMPGLVAAASPLMIGSAEDASESARIYRLAEVTGERMWSQQQLERFPEIPYDAETAAPSFTVAAAAQRENSRIVVVGDSIWASDLVTTNAHPALPEQGVGTAVYYGAAYPGNAELFINSVYWLADLESLIAASARTQDIRRIRIEPDAVPGLRRIIVGGMPIGALLIGLTVWFTRRRE